jgi:hypothetical protein
MYGAIQAACTFGNAYRRGLPPKDTLGPVTTDRDLEILKRFLQEQQEKH